MSPGPDTPGAGAGSVQSPAPVGGGGPDDGAGAKRDAETANVVGSPAAGDDGSARKKKKTGPGSRGVANLTPEQLAKKRANGELQS